MKKMKTFNPHSLLTESPRVIQNLSVISELYCIWKKLMQEKTDYEISDFDSFVAGYFLGSNSTLRQKYLELKSKDYFDSRISN